MFGDDDYGFLTGGLGDLDGDGDVDFAEYINEEDDYQRIMGNDDDGYSIFDDDDFDTEMLDEEYSDFDNDTLDLPDDFDISKISLTIGAETSLNYDGKPIDVAFANRRKFRKTIESKCKNPNGDYSIKNAIYNKFPEIQKLLPKEECECFEDAVLKCYNVHKKLGLSIWLWIIDNFPHALTSNLETQGTTQSWIICNYLLSRFGHRDLATREDYIYKHLSQHPELEDLIFQKSYFYSFPEVVSEYLSYCLAHNLRKNFDRVYFGFIKNTLISKFINKREMILEKTIEYYSDVYIKSINQDFFIFLKREILNLERNVKQNQILNKLNKLKGNYKN